MQLEIENFKLWHFGYYCHSDSWGVIDITTGNFEN